VKLTIYKKMMLGFGVIIIIMIIASTYILFKLNAVSNAAKMTLTANVQVVDLAKQLQAILHDLNVDAQKYIISRDETYFSLFVATSRQFDQHLNSLLDVSSDKTERSIVRNMFQAHESFAVSMQGERDSQDTGYNPVRDIRRSESLKILYTSLDHLVSINQVSIEKAMSRMNTTTSRSAKVALLLIVLTLLTAVSAAFLIARTITKPIDELIRGTERIAQGKYEPVRVSSNDEISLLVDAVNEMSLKIKNINELRTHMMQQISHELQSPLQVILSAHDILKDQCSAMMDAEQLQMLDTIRRGINKLTVFSKQYLDLAKIDSGMMKYHMEWTDLSRIVEPLVADARLIAASKDITVELTTSAAPKIMVDAKKISIVASNLLSNAIKYTRNNGRVRVNVGPCTIGAQFKIQDSGIGIAPEELPKVFTRFYQAGNIGRIKSGGIGVGLALVKAFTEGHGGKVYAESVVDSGSTFTVELPAAPEEFQGPSIQVPI
jgi:two-component system, NtrC family, sensor histidine kinase GlrK